MKLKENQLKLLQHLAQFESLEYQSCLNILDMGQKRSQKALSYFFRPLTKNKYVAKHRDGNVNILAKGRALFPNITPLVTTGGGTLGIKRTNTVSRTAMFFKEAGIDSFAEMNNTDKAYFIPSARWRKIRKGILDTTRFTGILFLGEHRLAVYDIKNGCMDWQLRAEKSLFYKEHDDCETRATGILFICDDDKRIKIAQEIIKLTMWNRKQLINSNNSSERDRPVKYVHAPMRLTRQYEHTYLTTPSMLKASIKEIAEEKDFINECRGNSPKCLEPKDGDYEEWPYRYFVNTTTDLLKYIYFFAAAKSLIKYRKQNSSELNYAIILPEHDYEILRMYPDVIDMEGMEFYEYRP